MNSLEFKLILESQASESFNEEGKYRGRGAHRKILDLKRFGSEFLVIYEDHIEWVS